MKRHAREPPGASIALVALVYFCGFIYDSQILSEAIWVQICRGPLRDGFACVALVLGTPTDLPFAWTTVSSQAEVQGVFAASSGLEGRVETRAR